MIVINVFRHDRNLYLGFKRH